MKTILNLALFLILGGCATVQTGELFNGVAKTNDHRNGIIYFFRLRTPPYARNPTILINNKKISDLPINAYFYLYEKPGKYTIKSKWAWDVSMFNKELELNVKPNTYYFIQLGSRMDYEPAFAGTTVVPVFHSSASLKVVPESYGIKYLTLCRKVIFSKTENAGNQMKQEDYQKNRNAN